MDSKLRSIVIDKLEHFVINKKKCCKLWSLDDNKIDILVQQAIEYLEKEKCEINDDNEDNKNNVTILSLKNIWSNIMINLDRIRFGYDNDSCNKNAITAKLMHDEAQFQLNKIIINKELSNNKENNNNKLSSMKKISQLKSVLTLIDKVRLIY